MTLMKAFYHRKIHASVIVLLSCSGIIGYGFAGVFMKFLISNPYMWYPTILPDVSLYRMLHGIEARQKGKLTRMQFFQIVFVISFAYFVIPNYFFPSLSVISFVCWIWKDSVTAQQLGSGLKGLGLGSVSFNWNVILRGGDPLVFPLSTTINTIVGFALFMYVITPIAYWENSYNTKRSPIFSTNLFDDNGGIYNFSRVLDNKTFSFDKYEFNHYSKVHLSTINEISYGIAFASVVAVLTHVALFHGREIWRQFKGANNGSNNDIHTRLMNKYAPIPQLWFLTILVLMLLVTLVVGWMNKDELQIPLWGLLLAVVSGFVFVLPISIITATTGQFISTNIIHGLAIGYLYPGRPLATITYRAYSYFCTTQACRCLSNFKIGHYTKIPPKSMFIAQVVGTAISTVVRVSTAWRLLSSVDNICHPELLPKGSPWTCPAYDVSFNHSLIWGLLGPSNVFGSMYLFTLLGFFGPILIWLLLCYFPEKKWIKLIHLPVILSPVLNIRVYGPVGYVSFFIVAIAYHALVFKKFKRWWGRYNYILSAALSTESAFAALVLYSSLHDIYRIQWWGSDIGDHCPLANCPTAKGIEVDSCPVFH